jgi:hypothetical protein
MDKEKLIILVQGRQCLYNLQHKDYDNNLVKDSSWKEIAGELHVQDKGLSRRTQHCWRMAGSWQGNGMVCVNRPLKCFLLLAQNRTARKLISGPCLGTKARILSFNRIQSRAVMGLLTRHNTLRRHLQLMWLSDSPLCRKCGAED